MKMTHMNSNVEVLVEYIANLIVQNKELTTRVETLETKYAKLEKEVQHMRFIDMPLM